MASLSFSVCLISALQDGLFISLTFPEVFSPTLYNLTIAMHVIESHGFEGNSTICIETI